MKHFIYILIVLVIASCTGRKSNTEIGSKSNSKEKNATEIPTLSYTIFTGKVELFVEFKALIRDRESSFAAHLNDLVDFKPFNEGSIKVVLKNESNTYENLVDKPSVPGIFRPVITPGQPGLYTLTFYFNKEGISETLEIDSVRVYDSSEEAIKTITEKPLGNATTFLKEQAWKVEFATMGVTPQSFSEIIKTSGEILPAQGDEMVVTANANGIITFAGNKAIAGTSVNDGEMLFAISGGNLTDGNTETLYKQAKATYEKAKADFERAQGLTKDNIISQKDFLESKAKYETEQANYNNLARNYQAGGQKVVSPISGFIKNVLVTEGQFVTVGQPLAAVSQNRRLMLMAEVSQKYFSKLASITSANFKAAYDIKTYNIESLNGRLLSYGKSNDANTLFIPVTFSFDNRVDIVPGSLVDVFLKLKPFSGAYVIPVSALIEEQGVFFAYVEIAGESFSKRELTLGGSDGINVQVLAGLKEGERVVTKGAYQIKLAAASGVIPAHGHAH
jgi:membrane fusion protein, heavy metal efflux system